MIVEVREAADLEDGRPTPDEVYEVVRARSPVRAICRVAWVAGKLGVRADTIELAVSDLVSEGLLERWDGYKHGPAVMLSSFVAEREGFRLSDRWPLRWEPLGKLGRQKSRPKRQTVDATTLAGKEGEDFSLARQIDPRAIEGLEFILEVERAAQRAATKANGSSEPPAPLVFIGLGAFRFGRPLNQDHCPYCRYYRAVLKRARKAASIAGISYQTTPAHCLACEWYSHQHLIPAGVEAAVRASWLPRIAKQTRETAKSRREKRAAKKAELMLAV